MPIISVNAGHERPSFPPEAAAVANVASHGSGAQNLNFGQGRQESYNQSEGSNNRLYHAEAMYFTQPPMRPGTERKETPPLPGSIPMPFSPNPYFVDRPELGQVEQKICTEGRSVAVVGLGGTGKTQIVAEFCHRLRRRSPDTWVLWLQANNSARFDASIANLVDDLNIFGRKFPSADPYRLIYDWLRDPRKGKWVVVIDNADDAGFLHEVPNEGEKESTNMPLNVGRTRVQYIPACSHGSMVITSRYRKTAIELVDDCDIITLQQMREDHAIALLKKRTGQQGDQSTMERLGTALGYMPLAVAQAAAYIRQRQPGYSMEQYLVNFEESEQSRTSLLEMDLQELRRDKDSANSIILSWQISFEHIYRSAPSAADLLSLMSFFDHQNIPEYLVRPIQKDDCLSVEQHLRFQQDIKTLCNYHFITISETGGSFVIHRLLQLAMRTWLQARAQYNRWAEQSLRSLDHALPDRNSEELWRWLELSPHVFAALRLQDDSTGDTYRFSLSMKAAGVAFIQR